MHPAGKAMLVTAVLGLLGAVLSLGYQMLHFQRYQLFHRTLLRIYFGEAVRIA